SFQQAIVEVFLDRFQHAFALVRDQHPTAIVIVGGVAANQKIRSTLEDFASSCGIPFVAPPSNLCTDNGAMIAWAGLEQYRQGRRDMPDFAPRAQWALQELSCGS
ncbi:MAG: tRNA (adenosine(37)-N6)-threonylcarbamoyltransferase complex transferase subunit TsaD, partial [Holosporales bacterium]|nr:tRNA (adenosine(37)-N6)-threonylcarbamoyltransferase complex transferase subunit TsaD [Holosporales bacterium]